MSEKKKYPRWFRSDDSRVSDYEIREPGGILYLGGHAQVHGVNSYYREPYAEQRVREGRLIETFDHHAKEPALSGTKKVDWTLPIEDVSGRKYRAGEMFVNSLGEKRRLVFCSEGSGEMFGVRDEDTGKTCKEFSHSTDIINTPAPPVEVEIGDVWVNIWRDERGVRTGGVSYPSAEVARKSCCNSLSDYLGPAKLPTKLTIE